MRRPGNHPEKVSRGRTGVTQFCEVAAGSRAVVANMGAGARGGLEGARSREGDLGAMVGKGSDFQRERRGEIEQRGWLTHSGGSSGRF
jgi:hypothetical protein